jgi:hypothetical protein
MAINSGVSPVDATSGVGKVRILLGDTDATDVIAGSGTYLYFSDNEIVALLSMYGDSPKLTAARALETIAASQVLLLKSWSSDDLTVNGDRIAESLRKLAVQLRAEALADSDSGYFDIIPFPVKDTETWWD